MDGEAPQAAPALHPGLAARPWLAVRRLELAIVASIVALDQLTKAVVRQAVPLHETIPVIPGLLNLTHVRNTGAAFGFLNATSFPFKSLAILLVATAALVGIAVYAFRLPAADRAARIGLALILGGAIGNLIDRALVGYVLDFVDAYWREYHFWAFNVADSAITIGAGLVVLDMLIAGRHVS
jgi:signal peptidase II